MRVEPLQNFPVIRDLIVEIGDFMRKLQRIKPDHPAGGEGTVGRRVSADAAGTGGIQAVQHVHQLHAVLRRLPDLRVDPHFIGPAAIALAQRYNHDGRDQGAGTPGDPLATRRHLGLHLRRGMHEGLSEECRSAGAIQRYKLDASVEWLKSFFMPRGAR